MHTEQTQTLNYYPLTKISDYNPTWKMEAWCRRNEGRWYLYLQSDGNVEVSEFERVGQEIYQVWKDGVKIFHTPFRLNVVFGVYTLVR